MLFRTIERMIERGFTEGLREKIDVFFAAGRLSASEYAQLTAMLGELGSGSDADRS